MKPDRDGAYEVVEVPLADEVPGFGGWVAMIPTRHLVLARPEAGFVLYVFEGFPDGRVVRSKNSVPFTHATHIARNDLIVQWADGVGFRTVHIGSDNEPVIVTAASVPAPGYTNSNNLNYWTATEDEILLWGKTPHPANTPEFWRAPLTAEGAVGTWVYGGAHVLPLTRGSDFGNKGPFPRLIEAPHVAMMEHGSGVGRAATMDLDNPLGGYLTVQDPTPGTTTELEKWSSMHSESYRRGPLMDQMLVHRNNLDANKPIEEWEWTGDGFAVKHRWTAPDGHLDLFPDRNSTDYSPFWSLLKLDNGVVIGLSDFLDDDYYDIGSLIYVDVFKAHRRQRFDAKVETGNKNRSITLLPVAVGAEGDTALAYSYEYTIDVESGEITSTADRKLLIIRPKQTDFLIGWWDGETIREVEDDTPVRIPPVLPAPVPRTVPMVTGPTAGGHQHG